METIFDFNPTSEELRAVTGEVCTKETYMQFMDEETANLHISELLWDRDNKVAAKLYVSKLPVMRQHDFWRTVTHP